MRQFIRSPLTWMVVAELVVVGVLVVVAWTAVTAATRPALASPTNQLPDSPSDSSALADLPVLTPGARGPLPGLNLDSRVWRGRLAELHRDQALLALLAWRIVHTSLEAMQRYHGTA